MNVQMALTYANLGLSVYPVQPIKNGVCTCSRGQECSTPGKHPYYSLGGVKAATSSLPNVQKVFAEANANVGLLCIDRFWVLDIDGEKGLDDLEQLVSRFGDLPKTPMVKTGGGGRHYYFLADQRVSNRTKIGGFNIDAKANGGMVVAPPSSHASGNTYEWVVPPWETSLARAPEWLIQFVSRGSSPLVPGGNDLRSAAGVPEGQRNSRLCQLIGAEIARNGITPELLDDAILWGRSCDPPLSDSEIKKTVRSISQKHKAAKTSVKVATATEQNPYELGCKTFEQIEPRTVRWLWYRRFPLGKLTLLTGDGGVGKSIFTCYLAACVTTGCNFVDGTSCPLGDVFFVCGEDGAEDTIRPRLDAAGADVSRVHLIRGPVAPGDTCAAPLDLSRHIDMLERRIKKISDLKLLVVDPVFDFLGSGVDANNATDVRRVLAPLRELAERYQVAVLLISHLNKSGRASKTRSLGSGAFSHVCRCEMRIAEDPDNPSCRLLLPVKNNLEPPTGLSYLVVQAPNGAGVLSWVDCDVQKTIDDVEANSRSEPRGALAEAKAWLKMHLDKGPVLSALIVEGSRRDGISLSTLKRAKYELGFKSFQQGRQWWWGYSLDKPDLANETAVDLAQEPPPPSRHVDGEEATKTQSEISAPEKRFTF